MDMINTHATLGKYYFRIIISSNIKSGSGPHVFLACYGSINAFSYLRHPHEYIQQQYIINMIYMCYGTIYELLKLCIEGGSRKVSTKFTPHCNLTINGWHSSPISAIPILHHPYKLSDDY